MTVETISIDEMNNLKSEGDHYGFRVFVDDDRLQQITPDEWKTIRNIVHQKGDIIFACSRDSDFNGLSGIHYHFASLKRKDVNGRKSIHKTVCDLLLPYEKVNTMEHNSDLLPGTITKCLLFN